MKYLMSSLCLCLGFLCLFSAKVKAAGPYSFSDYEAANSKCYSAIQALKLKAEDLADENQRFIKKEKDLHEKTKPNASIASKKEAADLAKFFKSDHLEFNKTIKDYQRKCKKVEKMIKGRVIYGRD